MGRTVKATRTMTDSFRGKKNQKILSNLTLIGHAFILQGNKFSIFLSSPPGGFMSKGACLQSLMT